ncbi:MAG TPA: hypothetical protein VN494_03365 [Patescibacteria group bacterium]|nr:hypothetical protein [Patescibacteria group bacterium]
MKAVTLRNLPPELTRVIDRKAIDQGTSVNKAVISLLEEALGRGRKKRVKPLHHDLDALAGSWTAQEAEAFDQALARQRTIDPDLWT